MRDQNWLDEKFIQIWNKHFSDTERKNPIRIKFGRKSKRRLGSIILTKEEVSLITLTGFFADETIPEYIVIETLAHELIHYIHGFSSKMKRVYKHPHRGNIIKREMEGRGLGDIHSQSRLWMEKNWKVYLSKLPKKRRKYRKKRRILTKFLLIRRII